MDEALGTIRQALLGENRQKAADLFAELLVKYPDNRPLAIAAAKFYIDENNLEKANDLLSQIQEDEKEFFAEAQAVKALVQFKTECNFPSGDGELDRKFSQACCLTVEGKYEEALELFLAIVESDRSYKNDGARKAMLSIFDLLGSDRSLTKEYRQRLMMVLF